jgi:hypothetical protein
MYKIMRSRFNEIISVTVEQQDGSVMCIPSDLANSDYEYIDGTSPKDLVHGHIHIDFLLKFYLKHRDQYGDEI